MIKEKIIIIKVREKSRNFSFSQGKLKKFNMANLIPLKAGKNIWVTVISTMLEERKFAKTHQSDWMKRAAVKKG